MAWQSSGWTHNRNVAQMLELLTLRGEVAIAARRGRERLWDSCRSGLPDRFAARHPGRRSPPRRNERRLTALGIAREKSTKMPLEPVDVGLAGEPAIVEGVPGIWRVDPAALGRPFTGRTALLSPFDRLTYDRVRAQQLFDFEYVLEMYKPAATRRWGYFALPILHGDRLVGKLDAAADRKAGVFRVNAVHEDVPFDRDAARRRRRGAAPRRVARARPGVVPVAVTPHPSRPSDVPRCPSLLQGREAVNRPVELLSRQLLCDSS